MEGSRVPLRPGCGVDRRDRSTPPGRSTVPCCVPARRSGRAGPRTGRPAIPVPARRCANARDTAGRPKTANGSSLMSVPKASNKAAQNHFRVQRGRWPPAWPTATGRRSAWRSGCPGWAESEDHDGDDGDRQLGPIELGSLVPPPQEHEAAREECHARQAHVNSPHQSGSQARGAAARRTQVRRSSRLRL